MYIINGSAIIAQANNMTFDVHDKARLWHMGLGRVGEKGLTELSKQNLLGNDKITSLDFCDHCILGKAKKVSFGIEMNTTTRPFEYI